MFGINFKYKTMAFVIHALGGFACKLNVYFLSMVNGIKK
jgi:hypothetical protein